MLVNHILYITFFILVFITGFMLGLNYFALLTCTSVLAFIFYLFLTAETFADFQNDQLAASIDSMMLALTLVILLSYSIYKIMLDIDPKKKITNRYRQYFSDKTVNHKMVGKK